MNGILGHLYFRCITRAVDQWKTRPSRLRPLSANRFIWQIRQRVLQSVSVILLATLSLRDIFQPIDRIYFTKHENVCLHNGWAKQTSRHFSRLYKRGRIPVSSDGVPLFSDGLFVPQSLYSHVLIVLKCGHLGTEKTEHLSQTAYWWPDPKGDLCQFPEGCNSVCIKFICNPVIQIMRNLSTSSR